MLSISWIYRRLSFKGPLSFEGRLSFEGSLGLKGPLQCLGLVLLGILALPAQGQVELTSGCTVSALNRSAPVDDEGTWVLPNVPTSLGRVRIRATCIEADGTVRHGQSDFVDVPPNGVIEVADIEFTAPIPSPTVLQLTTTTSELSAVGQEVQIAAQATYPDSSTAEVATDAGTDWITSNAAIVVVSSDGRATAVTSGVAIVSASHDGATGFLRFRVLVGSDGDMDGLPDDWEVTFGLDPNDPLDAGIDGDLDGLTSLEEFNLGTDPTWADSDDDRLLDGEEVDLGTDPLRPDTDGDFVPDGLEVQAGSDPLDPTSVFLAPILDFLAVNPGDFLLKVNEAFGEGSRQLTVTATLIDGTSLDATGPPYGTVYNSSDLSIASFSLDPGRVFGGVDGVATVSVSNGAESVDLVVTVEVFSPTALSLLGLPGCANAVAVDGPWVYVASSDPALVVVDASDLTDPEVVRVRWYGGSSLDLDYAAGHLYLAMHTHGLLIVNVADPTQPLQRGEVLTTGPAWGVVARPPWVYVATDFGISVIDVQNPNAPQEVATVETPGRARSLALDGDLLAVADGSGGLALVDVSTPESPQLVSSVATSNAASSRTAAVALRGGRAWTAEGQGRLGGLRALQVEDPEFATLIGSSSDRFGLNAIAIDGPIALTSDYFFVNAVPIFDISGPTPLFRATLTFAGDPNGHDLAIADGVVYSAAGRNFLREPSCRYGGRLQIGRYAEIVGEEPPTVAIIDPQDGDEVNERHLLRVSIDAEDDVLVTEVELWADGELVGIDTAAPYAIDVVPAAGASQLELVAYARDGAAGNRSMSETVLVDVLPDDQPVARIVAPPTGASVVEGTSLDVVVEATDDVQLDLVEFLIDGMVDDTATGSTTVFSVEAAPGATEVTVQARATDNLGQMATSQPVLLLVTPDPPPEVVILDPPERREVAANTLVQVEIGAADNRAVDRVELRVDGSSFGELSQPPYLWIINIPIGPETLTLEAEAWDDLDRSTTASLILDILPGATTRVEGTVVDPQGTPQPGSEVSCGGVLRTTDVDGFFSIDDFPVTGIGILCDAHLVVGSTDLVGVSELVEPVFSGTTDLGTLSLGAPLTMVGTGSTFGFDFSPNLYASDEGVSELIRWAIAEQGQPSGLAFDHNGSLWQARAFTTGGFAPPGTKGEGGGGGGGGGGDSWSYLSELDAGTAEPLGDAVFISTPSPGAAIIDLAIDPGTGRIYGLDHVLFTGGSRILSIDPLSGDATVVGTLPGYQSAGLDFDNQRRLWVVREAGGTWQMHQVDPDSGSVLATVNVSRSGTIAGMSLHSPSGLFLIANGDLIHSVLPGSPNASLWSTPSGQSSSGELAGIAIRRTGGAAVTTTFTGRVVNEFGDPIDGIDVLLPGSSTTSAADGSFSLEAYPRTSRVRLVVRQSNDHAYSDAVLPTAGGSTDVGDIVFSNGGGGGEG